LDTVKCPAEGRQRPLQDSGLLTVCCPGSGAWVLVRLRVQENETFYDQGTGYVKDGLNCVNWAKGPFLMVIEKLQCWC